MLGKVSPLFLKKTVPIFYGHLRKLAENLFSHYDNLKAFYQLLLLSTLEFSEPGLLDVVQYLSWLQYFAVESDFSSSANHCCTLHAIIAGVLYMITKISSALTLQEHITHVLEMRRSFAPYLLPGKVFSLEEKPNGVERIQANVDKKMLFILNQEELLRTSPEPRKGFGKL